MNRFGLCVFSTFQPYLPDVMPESIQIPSPSLNDYHEYKYPVQSKTKKQKKPNMGGGNDKNQEKQQQQQ
ncbi:hypothetical protein DERP_006850 [Dermatophagoides pteronyssinus]|uniref:Uncharacterized protein n=1 Tax=Dermatophagoides pteronyssinus TaxID=6956 RepID=A0ABQ8IS68_DERPT|nr:hypothetical protein DERP_006850 [Dermatophagoides pteronyssinus]